MFTNSIAGKFSSAIVTFSVITIATLTWQTAAFAQSNDTPHQRTANVIEKFKTQTMDADYTETRAADFVEELSKAMDTNFIFNESAADNAFDEETVLTIQLTNVRIATLLDEALRPYDCTWNVHDGVVTLLSNDSALDTLQIRTFDCSDLIARIKPIENSRTYRTDGGQSAGGSRSGRLGGGRFAIQEEKSSGAFGGRRGGREPIIQEEKQAGATKLEASNTATETNKATDKKLAEPQVVTESYVTSANKQLLDLIRETIDPDSWDTNGRDGRIQSVNGIVVVRQTNTNLRAIDDFLDNLRESGLMNN